MGPSQVFHAGSHVTVDQSVQLSLHSGRERNRGEKATSGGKRKGSARWAPAAAATDRARALGRPGCMRFLRRRPSGPAGTRASPSRRRNAARKGIMMHGSDDRARAMDDNAPVPARAPAGQRRPTARTSSTVASLPRDRQPDESGGRAVLLSGRRRP